MKWLRSLLQMFLKPIIYHGLALMVDVSEDKVRVLCDWPYHNTELNLPRDMIESPEIFMPPASVFILEVRQHRYIDRFYFKLVLATSPLKDLEHHEEVDKLFLETIREKYPKQKFH